MRSSIILCLLLAGCAHTDGVRIVYQDRPVPVIQKCMSASQRPVKPKPLGSVEAPTQLDTALAMAEAKIAEWLEFGNSADVIFDECQK